LSYAQEKGTNYLDGLVDKSSGGGHCRPTGAGSRYAMHSVMNVPRTVVTTTSAIVSAYRRVHGVNPPDGNLGDLSWLTLRAVKGPNLSSKDRPLFAGQQNDGASTVLEPGTVRKPLENYKTSLYAVSKPEPEPEPQPEMLP
jgi:hypothetical protein